MLAHLVVALELLGLRGRGRSPVRPAHRRFSLRKREDRVNCGVGVLVQALVVDVGHVIAELVVALVEREACGAAVERDLSGCLDGQSSQS